MPLSTAVALLAQADSHLNGSGLALLGGLVAVVRRKRAIGGWLFYFFWQVLLGLGLVLLTTHWKLYLPRAWNGPGFYFLYTIASLPRMLLLAAAGMIWVFLVTQREWPWVCALRYVLLTDAFLTLLKVLADVLYFPSYVSVDTLSLAFPCVWAAYFTVSVRVRRVFREKSWA